MIEWATLYTGAELYPQHKPCEVDEEEVWKGTVKTSRGRCDVYLKLLPIRKTIAEAVCASVGRDIGLPIPEPYLIQVTPELLPESRVVQHGQIAFALRDVGATAHSFAHFMNLGDPAALRAWKKWKRFEDTLLFDEWTANDDRNYKNVLFDGDFWLIDHAEALGGSTALLWGLEDPELAVTNKLLQERLPELTAKLKAELDSLAQAFELRVAQVDLLALLNETVSPALASPQTFGQIITFLGARRLVIAKLIRAKMGMPSLAN